MPEAHKLSVGREARLRGQLLNFEDNLSAKGNIFQYTKPGRVIYFETLQLIWTTLELYCGKGSLLCRGLLQSRWVEKRGGREKGKNKARGNAFSLFPSFPALPFSLSSAPASLFFFFHWCLLPGAFAEERVGKGKTVSEGQSTFATKQIQVGYFTLFH